MFKQGYKHSNSSIEFPSQSLRQIGPGVNELWSNKQTEITTLYIYRYYLRRSQYCRRISNSFRTLASRLQCLSVGCACTILWRQRAARARTCREGRGRFGLRWSRCRSWTKRGIHLLDLIISQLVGLEDIASRVLDIFSTSVHPAEQYNLNQYI